MHKRQSYCVSNSTGKRVKMVKRKGKGKGKKCPKNAHRKMPKRRR